MEERTVKLVLGNGHVRRFKIETPIQYRALRSQIEAVCRNLGEKYDIFHMAEDGKVPVLSDRDVVASCKYSVEATTKLNSRRPPTIRYLIRRRSPGKSIPANDTKVLATSVGTVAPPVVDQPSSFDDPAPDQLLHRGGDSNSPVLGEDAVGTYASDCLSDPCPPLPSTSSDRVEHHLDTSPRGLGVQSGIQRDSSFRTDTSFNGLPICRSELSVGHSRELLCEDVESTMETLDSRLSQNMGALRASISELERASSHNLQATAATCRNLVGVAESLQRTVEDIKDLKRRFYHQVASNRDRKQSLMQQNGSVGLSAQSSVSYIQPEPANKLQDDSNKKSYSISARKATSIASMKAEVGDPIIYEVHPNDILSVSAPNIARDEPKVLIPSAIPEHGGHVVTVSTDSVRMVPIPASSPTESLRGTSKDLDSVASQSMGSQMASLSNVTSMKKRIKELESQLAIARAKESSLSNQLKGKDLVESKEMKKETPAAETKGSPEAGVHQLSNESKDLSLATSICSDGKMRASAGFVDLQRSLHVRGYGQEILKRGETHGDGETHSDDQRYGAQLQALAERGWSDTSDLVFKKILLKFHQGDIDKVIDDLRDYHKIGT
mmetsp:Transcript_26758/g.37231  ORF Transcript_26758/g.37231 Transcript_26758/m.37231 type:complete len:609 (-) Transcript_26758:541-2367(-)